MYHEGNGGKPNPAHDNAIQALHRIAGRYPVYGNDCKPCIKLWTPKDRHEFLVKIMDLHSQILGKYREYLVASGGGAPFTPGGEVFRFVEDEYKKIRLTKPQVNKVLVASTQDGKRLEAFRCSLKEARDLSQDFEALKSRIVLECDFDPPLDPLLIVEGNRVWNQEQEDLSRWEHGMQGDVEVLTNALRDASNRVPMRSGPCMDAAQRLMNISIAQHGTPRARWGFHSASLDRERTNDDVWNQRFMTRPSTRSGRENFRWEKQSRVIVYLSKNERGEDNIVGLVTNMDNVKPQAELHRDRERKWGNVSRGARIVAYWYPDGRSGDSMICALDFPDEHPYQDRRCAMLTDNHCGLE